MPLINDVKAKYIGWRINVCYCRLQNGLWVLLSTNTNDRDANHTVSSNQLVIVQTSSTPIRRPPLTCHCESTS